MRLLLMCTRYVAEATCLGMKFEVMKYNIFYNLFYTLAMGLLVLSNPLQAANLASTSFTISGILEAKTCSFNETSRTIQLPEVDTQTLNGNAISGSTKFALKLNCQKGVSIVSIVPSGTPVESGDTTLFMNSGSAKNVGLRLLDNGNNVLTPDGQSKATFDAQTSGGVYVVTVGYAGTGSGRVSGGSFLSVVTFSLNYS